MHALEAHLVMVLLELIVIIGVARGVGVLFKRMGQPMVVGEILAGMILGPSVLGKIEMALWGAHPISEFVFNREVNEIFQILKELGLVFLLFIIGMEFDFSHLKTKGRSALAISAAGLVLPFALGFGLAWLILPYLDHGTAANTMSPDAYALGFALFMGTAMSITALPILGRMMMEWGVTRTRMGAITITAAAMDDAVGWILLGAVASAVAAGFSLLGTVKTVAMVIGYALFAIYVLRPVLVRFVNWDLKRNKGHVGMNAMAILIVMLFLSAIATSKIGIFAIFGAFILGTLFSDQHEFRKSLARQWQNFIFVFFLPIFFTYTGLRTDMGALHSNTMWLIAAAVIGAAIFGKFFGCAVAARWSGFGWRESTIIGAMMNTRALMELIVINVGYNLGVIPQSVFTMLVMMAVLTTIMTTPIVTRLIRNTEFYDPMSTAIRRGRDRTSLTANSEPWS
jgi:Kef-type K+ transport system membrane component KefB